MESYNHKNVKKLFGDIHFVQDNESESSRGVLRGLHFQKPPFSQSKLIWVKSGKIYDVVVNIGWLQEESFYYHQDLS